MALPLKTCLQPSLIVLVEEPNKLHALLPCFPIRKEKVAVIELGVQSLRLS
jgi:hypothetical protein